MTDLMVLQALQDFLKQNVAQEIFLMKPQDNNISTFELVHPSVHIAYLPPANVLPSGVTHTIPCILVGLENGEDTGTDASINIKLTFAVFNPGEYTDQGLKPGFEGYKDLLNLMTLSKLKLLEKHCIYGITTVKKPISWGLYDEPPYPYWYGYMTFSVPIASIEYNQDIISNFD